ncbi:hypothetical protein PLESTB_000639100 [Pleodorina starrii]|uniref:Uncharacterized protein n=1 Tax=Pleodorina starrii TaxID=330485 RepID=A0A9W6BIN6_9CHLO|nr:hypothetical protein PLESTB_000639100 [Pleodorina starrii]GLC71524.1 hypothetical protein PLESTF_001131300 [Pleodorina starrii]
MSLLHANLAHLRAQFTFTLRRTSGIKVGIHSPCGRIVPRPATCPSSNASRGDTTSCRSSAGYGPSATAQKREAQLNVLRQELKALEDERDEAVRTAESCAKTCVRLTDMSKLLEDLALEKVRTGDEAGAKTVLQEKNSLREIIDKSNSKAQVNFALAGKLAALIGDKHNELVALLGDPNQQQQQQQGWGQEQASSSERPVYGSGSSWPEPPSPVSGYGSRGVTAAGGYGSGGGGGGYQMPWERSLVEARQRVRQAEAEAQRMGRLAAMSAEDSIAAARERLAQRGPQGPGDRTESILQARERLRRSAEESIAEARERLRAQDTQILEYCRRIVTRYRRGEYVSEDELEFAFEQLERRLL